MLYSKYLGNNREDAACPVFAAPKSTRVRNAVRWLRGVVAASGRCSGCRTTTVTIAARLLQGAGLIRYRRSHIQILNRAALEGIACECYGVMRQNANKVYSDPAKAYS